MYAADVRNPYVYAHTSSAVQRLVKRAHELSAVHPAGKDMPIYVIAPDGDYWPLPWYLREFRQVGFFTGIPQPLEAAMIIAPPALQAQIESALSTPHYSECHALRPGVLRSVFIPQWLWDAFMATRGG